MAVSKRLRYEVLRRDNHACRYCGQMAPDVKLHVDHVVPVALGGSDEPSNLVTACMDCNSGKSATPADAALVNDVSAKALRWAEAIRAAADAAVAESRARTKLESDFLDFWELFAYGPEWNRKQVPLPSNYGASLHQFMAAGLPWPLILDAVEIAMNSRASADETFRYFCGVCWRKVSELQQQAFDSLGED